jgi:hypothetical protein
VTAPRPRIRRPVGKVATPTESVGQLRVAGYLHAVLPGANPRWVIRPRKAVRASLNRVAMPATKGRREPSHPWAMWWHTPNEGKRSLAGGQQLVNMGLRSGVGDLAFVFQLTVKRWCPAQGKGEGRGNHVPAKVAQAAYIEMKREGGGKLSDDQLAFRDHCAQVGAWWAECRTVAEVDAQLRAWLEPWGVILPPCPPSLVR